MKGEKKVGVASGLQSGALGLEGDGIALEVARRAGDERVQVGSVHTRVGCLAARARSGANPTRVIAAAAKPVWRGGNLDKATRRHWPAFHPRREIHGAAAAQAAHGAAGTERDFSLCLSSYSFQPTAVP